MDIKWKNNIKLLCLVVLLSFGLNGTMTGYHLITQQNQFMKTSYFQTFQFEQQLQEFVEYLSLFELSDMTKKAIHVSDEEIYEHRYRFGNLVEQVENIRQQYEARIQQAIAEGKEEVGNALIVERDMKIEDITKNFQSDEHVRQKIVKEKEQKIDDFVKELERYKPRYIRYVDMFTYYFVDQEAGYVYTNLSIGENETVDDLLNDKTMQFMRSYPSVVPADFYHRYLFGQDIQSVLVQGQKLLFSGYVGVPTSLPETSEIMVNKKNFEETKRKIWIFCVVSIIALLCSAFILRKQSIADISVERFTPYYNRLPIDIRAITFLITSFIFLNLITSNQVFSYFHNVFLLGDVVRFSFIAAFFLTVSFIQGKLLYEAWKEKPSYNNTFMYASYCYLRGLFHHLFSKRGIFWKFLILSMLVGGGVAFVILVSIVKHKFLPFALLLLGGIIIVVFLYIIIQMAYFNRIVSQVDDLVKGTVQQELPVKGSGVLGNLASNINTLKQGVQASKREVVKSERLKTELITNVSHDLRTPLTSIITYTELLKQAQLPIDERQSYVEIIDRKSKRLKVLIDDLFEVSKMASGNIELEKTKVDIVQLLQQALAEHNETMSASTLQFRITKPDNPIHVVVDGKKLWRVFDNLIGNILKYSLENTRVYISLVQEQNDVVITFKNVSKFELGRNSEELFERFKRGDISRQTEGSGLGLAIAKSIVDLHEGELDIELDGDLFKVTLKLSIV